MENNWNTIELVEQIIDTNKIKYFKAQIASMFQENGKFYHKIVNSKLNTSMCNMSESITNL